MSLKLKMNRLHFIRAISVEFKSCSMPTRALEEPLSEKLVFKIGLKAKKAKIAALGNPDPRPDKNCTYLNPDPPSG